MAEPASQRIDIPIGVFFKLFLAIILLYFVYQVLDVLALVFVAIILATAMEPAVSWLQRSRIPRAVSVLIMYLLIFLVITLVVVLLVPPLVQQLRDLASSFPYYYGKLLYSVSHLQGVQDEVSVSLQQALQSVGANLAQATTSLLGTLAGIFGGLVQFAAMLVIAFYLVVDENGVKRFAHSVTPSAYQPYVAQLMRRIQEKLGGWLRGQLLLMAIIGVLTYIGLSLIGMEYALVLALWAGLTEIIPYIGPVLGAIPAVFLALSGSSWQALFVLGLYVLIQQLENNLIVPMVMRRAVGLNPVVSIVVILIGAKLGGVVGAIISIPLVTAAAVFLSDFFDQRLKGELKVEGEPEPKV